MQKTFFYARVPHYGAEETKSYVDPFRELGAEEHDIYLDRWAVTEGNRKSYNFLTKYIMRHGDTLIVNSLEDISFQKTTLIEEIKRMRRRGIRLCVLSMPSTMREHGDNGEVIADAVTDAILDTIPNVPDGHNPYETGKRGSWKHPADYEEIVQKWRDRKMSVCDVCSHFGISTATFYKHVRAT